MSSVLFLFQLYLTKISVKNWSSLWEIKKRQRLLSLLRPAQLWQNKTLSISCHGRKYLHLVRYAQRCMSLMYVGVNVNSLVEAGKGLHVRFVRLSSRLTEIRRKQQDQKTGQQLFVFVTFLFTLFYSPNKFYIRDKKGTWIKSYILINTYLCFNSSHPPEAVVTTRSLTFVAVLSLVR